MAVNADLLRESIEIAVAREPLITKRFYEILFERYPEVQPLFGRNEPRRQQQMLQDTIVAALDHIDDGAWLEENLGALGAKHVTYGVTDDMYPAVGECLIAALADLCGDQWTDEHEASWATVYGMVLSRTWPSQAPSGPVARPSDGTTDVAPTGRGDRGITTPRPPLPSSVGQRIS
jgi:hemoglobin-like flavoprotein